MKAEGRGQKAEVPLKQWLAEEGLRVGRKPSSVWNRLRDGKCPGVRERRVNQRVIYVTDERAN